MSNEQVKEAKRKLEAASEAVFQAAKAREAAHAELEAAELAQRAKDFNPNATILKDQFANMPVSTTQATPTLVAGERVQVVPGQMDFDPWVATRKDGQQFEGRPQFFKQDGHRFHSRARARDRRPHAG